MTPVSMKRFRILLIVSLSLIAFAQQPLVMAPLKIKAMLAAVSRDGDLVTGGIGPGRQLKLGHAYVEPIAYLTDSGKWESLPCGAGREGTPSTLKGCEQFGRQYLSKPHTYIVISADGEGATVHSAQTKLNECFDYTANGTYSGVAITRSAIAASNPDYFSHVDAPIILQRNAAKPMLQALAAFIPTKLSSLEGLKVISLRLEDHDLIIAKREFADLPKTIKVDERLYVFAIGTMEGKRFRVLHWENSGDSVEGILGVIRLKNGYDFLITSVRDPEGQWFRVYGMENGKLTLVFSGGGSSC
jgi:hypothetical protein